MSESLESSQPQSPESVHVNLEDDNFIMEIIELETEDPDPEQPEQVVFEYVECNRSGQSKLNTLQPGPPKGLLKRRRLSSSANSATRPLKGAKVVNAIFYGSEGDSSDAEFADEEEEQRLLVPRAARMFMADADDMDEEVNTHISYEWPPPTRPVSSPESALAQELQPEQEPAFVQAPRPDEEVPSDATYDPKRKFDFAWRAFAQPQIPPNLRREPFSDIDCGPTVPLATPCEAFMAIWDRAIMEHIAVETNRYAQQLLTAMREDGTLRPNSRMHKWKDTDAEELYGFFAIILATGVVAKTRLEEYWSASKDIFSTPGFSASMPYDRFYLLGKCLHFSDNSNCNPDILTRAEAKLFKVQPVLDHLNEKFSRLYNMSQNIVLDESLTRWKGWLNSKQFFHSKAATVGIKSHEICESQTGYLWRFEVHAGHENPEPQVDDPVSGVVPALVLRLLNGLEHKGHTVWMDNFYNSPALARELKVRGFDCVGTLRTNRQFVPVELANLKSDMAAGQVCGCTSGDVDLVVWRDRTRVALISTYHGLATAQCVDKPIPNIVPDYNACMAGVDLKDQMIAIYPIERRLSRIWYKTFFRRLLNASVLNAYIMLKSQRPMAHRVFRKTLVQQLLARSAPQAPCRELSATHWPAQYEFIGNGHERVRRKCSVCKKRTSTYCKGCSLPLCVFTCFEPRHAGVRDKSGE